jgi:hypothetical protein
MKKSESKSLSQINDHIIDRILFSPLMIPGLSIPRFHEEIGYYEISYSSEHIHSLFKNTDRNITRISLDHNGVVIPCKVLCSIIKGLDFKVQLKRNLSFLTLNDIQLLINKFDVLPKGTWFQILEFDTIDQLQNVLNSGKTGLSVELKHSIFVNGKNIILSENYERVDAPKDCLPFTLHIYGGSIWSYGRNEHGKAHFELKLNGKSVDKIFIPYSNKWTNSTVKQKIKLLESEKGRVSIKERKKIVEWLDSKNNLKRCHDIWNKNNEYNKNRTILIF